jgi:integrase
VSVSSSRASALSSSVSADLVPIVDRWSTGKAPGAWLFEAPNGGPLRESNWKRSVGWSTATAAAGLRGFRIHDLRHTAASVWLGARADPKVVQRVLGHATAAMTMDLYGHLVDDNLREAARGIGGILGASEPPNQQDSDGGDSAAGESAS